MYASTAISRASSFHGRVLGRGLGLDGDLVHGLFDLRFFLLAARRQGGDCRDREHRYKPFDYSHA